MLSTLAVAASAFLVASAGPVPEKRTNHAFNANAFHGVGAVPFVGQLPANVPFHGSPANPFQTVSLNGWGGFQSLNRFDDFFGVNDFSGHHAISSLVVQQQPQLVCQTIPVHLIQQQLLVVREYVKKLVTTQICEVEVQTIVFSQFQAGVFDFGHDLRHVSGRPVGFDSHIANQIVNIHDLQGGININDLQFGGNAFGQNFVQPSGFNWNDATSPITINNAFGAAQSAFVGGNVFTAPPSSALPGLIVPPSPGSVQTTTAFPPVDTSIPQAPPALVEEPLAGPGVSNVTAEVPPATPPPVNLANLAVPVSAGGDDSSSVDPNPASD